MKKIILVLLLLLFSIDSRSQKSNVQLKDVDGKTVSSYTLMSNGDCPVLICFFATWCKPCLKELNNINENYDEWVEQTGVRIIAISIDNARTKDCVRPLVLSSDWQFEVYIDENSDFKRYMNVTNVPHSFILLNRNIIYQHTSYIDGDEIKIYNLLKKL
jgi:cytochrome c biogenesis protein CcmG, thiol:disulfide interchange protein DsbE